MKIIFLLAAVLSVATATVSVKKRDTSYQANLNAYVDDVVSNLQNYIVEQGMNEIALPNVTQTFSHKPLLITYSGRLSLFDGVIRNLKSVRRTGDVVLKYEDDQLVLSADVGIETLTYGYEYSAKLMGISASGGVSGGVGSSNVVISITGDLPNYELSLNSFALQRVGTISARLSGNAVTDWFANIIIRRVISLVRSSALQTVAQVSGDLISDVLTKVNAVIKPSSF